MKRSLIHVFLAVAACLGIFIGSVWLLSRSLDDTRETLYDGRPYTYWLVQLNGQDLSASNRANAVLEQQIIPHLMDVLLHDRTDSKFKTSLVDTLNQLPGITIHYWLAVDRLKEAAYQLGEFGPSARAAIPGLIQVVNGDSLYCRQLAIVTLGEIHGDPDVVIPLLTSYLGDDDMKGAAAEALGKYGNLARPSEAKLVPLLKANDPEDQKAAQAALKNIDPAMAKPAGTN